MMIHNKFKDKFRFRFRFIPIAILIAFIPILTTAGTKATASLEVRKIIPPKLDEAHIGSKILCHRPMRRGSPNMSIEQQGEKIIAHNYGHGGSGWTLAPGCANYVNNLLLNSEYAQGITKDTPIAIIGAGVLGLFTAYDLEQKGFKNITIIAKEFDDLTSHNAGGILAPVSMDNDLSIQKIIDDIGIEAYKFFSLIAQKKHKDFKDGAVILPAYFESREVSGLESYVSKVMKPAKDVILDFDNGTTRKMVSYDDGIFIYTAKMMEQLNEYLKQRNIKFVQKEISSFNGISEKFIINCSGIGAKELNNDDKMLSVQGHLIMLKNQQPQDLQHMILVYFDEGNTISKSNQKIKRLFYMLPKQSANTDVNDIGVIGGTFIEGADHTTPNDEEFDIILDNAKKFYGIKG